MIQAYWIPCSERLPKEYQDVLITKYDGDIDIGNYGHNEIYGAVWYSAKWNRLIGEDDVVAWMKLPEPYTGATK